MHSYWDREKHLARIAEEKTKEKARKADIWNELEDA